MPIQKVKYALVALWSLGFLLCLAIILITFKDIPNQFGAVLNEVFDTYSPPLAIMLGFIFSARGNKRVEGKARRPVSILAVVFSLAYITIFCFIMLRFAMQSLTATELVKLFAQIRPKTSFLVAGTITYYFASAESGLQR